MKISNDELEGLLLGLQGVKTLKGFRFAMVVSKNIDIVTKEIKALTDAIQAPDDVQEYEKTRIALCEKHAEKNDSNEASILNGSYVLKDKIAFDKEYQELKKANKELIDTESERLKGVEKFLEEDSKIELKMVSQNDIPNEIAGEQVHGIRYMIEDY